MQNDVPFFEFSGCYIYTPISSIRKQKLTAHSIVIGPIADCYLQCKSHFGVNVSIFNSKLSLEYEKMTSHTYDTMNFD